MYTIPLNKIPLTDLSYEDIMGMVCHSNLDSLRLAIAIGDNITYSATETTPELVYHQETEGIKDPDNLNEWIEEPQYSIHALDTNLIKFIMCEGKSREQSINLNGSSSGSEASTDVSKKETPGLPVKPGTVIGKKSNTTLISDWESEGDGNYVATTESDYDPDDEYEMDLLNDNDEVVSKSRAKITVSN